MEGITNLLSVATFPKRTSSFGHTRLAYLYLLACAYINTYVYAYVNLFIYVHRCLYPHTFILLSMKTLAFLKVATTKSDDAVGLLELSFGRDFLHQRFLCVCIHTDKMRWGSGIERITDCSGKIFSYLKYV